MTRMTRMTRMSDPTPDITLQSIAGPQPVSRPLQGQGPIVIGRAAECDVCLVNERVSRRHAAIVRKGETWFIIDVGSTHGTYVNGLRVPRDTPAELSPGDLVRVGPWTFRVAGGRAPGGTTITTISDDPSVAQRIERATGAHSVSDKRLKLLSECVTRLNSTADEDQLARLALDSALQGSGYARGAILRRGGRDVAPGDADVSLVVQLRREPGETGELKLSRSLIQAATRGETAVLMQNAEGIASYSIAELGIHSALCAPVPIGEDVVAFIYLDARGSESSVRADAAGFCEAVARAYGLSLANLKRTELERRQVKLAAELAAAREVQSTMMPPREADLGVIRYGVEVRPGLFVAGDLFDVISLGDGRVAVCLGDVAGHGVGSALLMAMTQSHLHAELRRTSDPATAVDGVNRYLCERVGGGWFVSLWVGVFGPGGAFTCVDAGHGHAMLARSTGGLNPLVSGDGIPLGIDAIHRYAPCATDLAAGDRIVVYSDGVIEQRGAGGELFGQQRLIEALLPQSSPGDLTRAVFTALAAFSGTLTLSDDATVAVIDYLGR